MDQELDKQADWEIGIDEAGRGPVLGPMIYGACAWPIAYREKLSKLGFDDSKKLTEQKRETLFHKIQELQDIQLHYEVEILSAQFISNSQIGFPQFNLNELSHNSAMNLIKKFINLGYNIKNAYLDTVGPKASYASKLSRNFAEVKPDLNFIVSEKADSLFPVVSAASICAKVIRDHMIRDHKYEEKMELSHQVGSGYPADPNTKSWLENNYTPIFAYPTLIRFSWGTIKDLLKAKNLAIEFEFEANQKTTEEAKENGQQTIEVSQQPRPKKFYNISYDGFSY